MKVKCAKVWERGAWSWELDGEINIRGKRDGRKLAGVSWQYQLTCSLSRRLGWQSWELGGRRSEASAFAFAAANGYGVTGRAERLEA